MNFELRAEVRAQIFHSLEAYLVFFNLAWKGLIFMAALKLSDIKKGAHIFFIGIGGISMSGLAQVALRDGYRVSGSDRSDSNIVKKLRDAGAEVFIGHDAEHVKGADLVVHTAAVHEDNPEMAACTELGIKRVDRAEFLGAIMREYKSSVGVSGTHGKTTTTGMLAHALIHAGIDPTISIGGELDLIDGNIHCGTGDCFVTEACEYTNSFLKFFPTIALITNIEEDHLDFFSGIDEIRESFRTFAYLTKDVGSVVAMYDDDNVRKALSGCDDLNIISYGMDAARDYHPENLKVNGGFPEFDVVKRGEVVCYVKLNVPGKHNVLNALAAVAVCELLGIDAQTAADGLGTFKGTHRRFEIKGYLNGALVIDDYAHHPTEIRATLSAAKEFPHKRIWCVFQSHTYSRTRTLWKDFVEAFDDADILVMTHIYPAREVFDGVTKPEKLTDEIKARGVNAIYIDDFKDIEYYLRQNVGEGDLVFTMGAGDVTVIGNELVK